MDNLQFNVSIDDNENEDHEDESGINITQINKTGSQLLGSSRDKSSAHPTPR